MKFLEMCWAILVCVFTDPLSEHYIYWDEEDNLRVVRGRTWSWQELFNHFFGPRIR